MIASTTEKDSGSEIRHTRQERNGSMDTPAAKKKNEKATGESSRTDPHGGTLGHAGRYVLLSVIGSGGQSTVYLARDDDLGRPVAIKVLRKRSRHAEIRIQREARVLAQLKHPAICQIYDIGTTSNHGIYLVLELLEGETLWKMIEKFGTLSIERTVAVAQAVAAALGAAHAQGVVHRDLKPGNIAVLPDGTLKLFDFGLATETRKPTISVGVRLGTYGYMSPEQYLAEPADTPSDIFSLGCIVYKLLTGRVPFATGEDLCHGRYETLPDKIGNDLGFRGIELLRRMLAVDPNERPTAGQVWQELQFVAVRLAGADRKRAQQWDGDAIVRLLNAIPAEDQPSQPVGEIAEVAAAGDEDVAMAMLQLPLAFGALRCSKDALSGAMRVRATSEVARYFLKSLALYVRNGVHLIDRWERRDDPSVADSVALIGADFVYAMEHRRVFQHGLLEPTRVVWPTQLIIKGYSEERSSPVYLMQYDRFAQQYQFIGGRRRKDESAIAAMHRRISEELRRSGLQPDVDYELDLVRSDVVTTQLSRTYGAFTEYHFSIFLGRFKRGLVLDEHDRWVTEEELFSGQLESDPREAWNYRAARVANAVGQGLATLPYSFPGLEISSTTGREMSPPATPTVK
ncbi:MAG TPA: protein kinase [Thermoanaerobaculia bacterium]|jgi:tRNA A-37 threonylcarbamoyl transferase component Bud32